MKITHIIASLVLTLGLLSGCSKPNPAPEAPAPEVAPASEPAPAPEAAPMPEAAPEVAPEAAPAPEASAQ